jgi:hypothetical protein
MLIFGWTAVVAAAAPTVRSVVAEERPTVAASYPTDLAALAPDLGVTLGSMEELAPLADLEPLTTQAADCENLRDSRARSVSGTNGPVRMFTTDHEGTRICVTVRGDDADRAAFIPRGRLPEGVVLTLGTSNGDGERRLEIEGTSRGNEHRWYVDGRSRPFDSEAAEWRDAMLELVGVLTEQADANRARAVEAMGVARRDMERARVAVGSSAAAERRAIARAHADAEVAARVSERAASVGGRAAELAEARAADEMAVAGRRMEHEALTAHAQAEVHARRALEMARDAEEVAVAGVGRGGVRSARGGAMVAPRASGGRAVVAPRITGGRGVASPRAAGVDQEHEREMLAEHRRAMEERRVQVREHTQELREHARQLEREHRRMAEEIRSSAPVISEGRGGVRMREVPVSPREPVEISEMPTPALRRVPTPPAPRAVPSIREREVTQRELEAAERLRRAIRVTGET